MTILSDEALEFARDHITRYYDSDFFPRQFEFDALWDNWDEVKKYLKASNVHKLPSFPPLATPWAKHRGGYRIVHQLDPVDAVVYTALAFEIATDIELARIPAADCVACAYRIAIHAGSFFAQGSGYEAFRERSIKLADSYKFVLVADVADYYNQISTHRVNNAIEHSSNRLKAVADDIEVFLGKLNSKASQGIPVGPAPSIIMAEAVMIDVDQHLVAFNCPHVRYVDDIRVFSNNEQSLKRVLQELTLYLYQTHRLSLSSEKTRIVDTQLFLSTDLNNPYELEKIDVIERIAGTAPYGGPEEIDDDEVADTDPEELAEAIGRVKATVNESLQKLVERRALDIGFCRALIRQARAIRDEEAGRFFLENVSFFEPVANNFIVYLHSITTPSFSRQITGQLERVIDSGVLEHNRLLRFWFEWYCSEHIKELPSDTIERFLVGSPHVVMQARHAVAKSDLAWVRKYKANYFSHGPRERRAILFASQILPEDERVHWLQNVIDASAVPLERWVARFYKDYKKHVIYGDDIPF